MGNMKIPKLMIAGISSGVGKTTLTMGILASLSKRMSVQSFKVGPDYIDPAYHTFITGRKCRNLDNYLLSNETVENLFYKNMKDAQIGIIEGVMGLYDGAHMLSDIGSSSSVAKALNCPVVLVVDGSGIAKSIAAIVKGFIEFDPNVNICGVIINKVNSANHYELLKEAIERNTPLKCFGYLPKNNMATLKSRHLGLIPSCEVEDLHTKISALSRAVEETIDLKNLIQLAADQATDMSIDLKSIKPYYSDVHIGVAYDEAFNFYYEDNLELFKELGAKISFFSPMKDKELPIDINLIYFGGGFPEIFAEELSDNQEIKNDIYQKLSKGMPYFAECGGLMYLTKEIHLLNGKSYPMVGWFEGYSNMTKRLQRFGYKTLTLNQDCILGRKGESINVHEFHHSETEIGSLSKVFVLEKVRDGQLINTNDCGYVKGNGVAGYPHFHFYGNQEMAINLLKLAQNYREHIENSMLV